MTATAELAQAPTSRHALPCASASTAPDRPTSPTYGTVYGREISMWATIRRPTGPPVLV
jgi:hypothetical protein